MQQDQRNLILAVVISALLLFGYQFTLGRQHRLANPTPPAATSPAAPVIATSPAAQAERSEVLAEAPRIKIETPKLHGTLSLAGGRIDDLVLANYYETIKRQKLVTLLSPAGSVEPFYVEFGWTADGGTAVPTSQTVWTANGDQTLTPQTPVTLTWDNGSGLAFTRTISVDADYLFTIKQSVVNHGTAPVTLHPYGTIVRANAPSETSAGGGAAPTLAGNYGNGLDEVSYKDLTKKGAVDNQATGGWVGMNDKYWLVAAAPPKDQAASFALRGVEGRFTAGYRTADITVAPGATADATTELVAGAKEQGVLERYQDDDGMATLEKTIDFGWLYILAKPFFLGIHYIAAYVGNFGVAILIFNVFLKLILFPLQDRSFHQMARMRDVQPKIAALKEKFGDDREKMATAQMELFKKEKINPASGCLPILIQLPIFYALYRVLSTTIEMRHAPFFGWIHDLSAPDPTTILNLFGLIPWTPPAFIPTFLHLGIWPLVYGLTMYLQQRMTPTPTADPAQARIMALMPLVFMFLFAQFPAGLTIYYSWNAVLTMGQMALIRRRSEARKAATAAGSA